MLKVSTIRPGLMVALSTSVTGNVSYTRQDLEANTLENGEHRSKWETVKTIIDPSEHEAAVKCQSKISSLIRGVCTKSKFSLLCPKKDRDVLDSAIVQARAIAEEFNGRAKLTMVEVFVMVGEIAESDAEAIRGINSEVRELLGKMQDGVRELDAEKIRAAANAAKQLGAMLSPAAEAKAQAAIDAVRRAAREIVKAGETGAVEIDRFALRKISEARTAFLDMEEGAPIAAPKVETAALDFEPKRDSMGTVPAPSFALEL